MAMPAGYKPSPLGYGSPRGSPFRRPESPSSPSPLSRQVPGSAPIPVTAPLRIGTPTSASTPTLPSSASAPRFSTPTPSNGSWTPRNYNQPSSPLQPAAEIREVRSGAATPTRYGGGGGGGGNNSMTTVSAIAQGTALTQLQPAQVRTLREGFQILDRDSDGTVQRDDVADMLNQLGLPSTPADVSHFFPPAAPQTMAMGTFLNTIATALAAMSPSTELLSALSAFDEDDSGQIDVAELRDALLHTAPEAGEPALTEADIQRVLQGFSGRRAFTNSRSQSKQGLVSGSKRGDVFRYQEFVQSVAGGQDKEEPRDS